MADRTAEIAEVRADMAALSTIRDALLARRHVVTGEPTVDPSDPVFSVIAAQLASHEALLAALDAETARALTNQAAVAARATLIASTHLSAAEKTALGDAVNAALTGDPD